MNSDIIDDEIDKKRMKLWYKFIKSIMDDCLEKFPKSAKLHMLCAYL